MWFGGDSPNSDNLLLSNRDRLPIVINMTCNSGAIDYPQPSWNVCISEDFMRVENGGAVACFVPSGPGLTVQHERLMMEIGPTLFSETPRPMGESLQLALWRYLANQNPPDLAQMYILLGDPLLVPQIALAGEPDGDAAVAQEAGFIVLPPGPDGAVRHGQVKAYDGGFASSDIRELGANARLFRPEPEDLEHGGVVAISTVSADQASTLAQSFFLPADELKNARVTRWRRLDDSTVDDGLAVLEFTLTNELPVPVTGVSISAKHQTCPECESVDSETVTIPAMGTVTCTVEIQLEPGLNRYALALVSGSERFDVDVEPPVTLAGIRPDGNAGVSLPPAVMDPDSLQVRYRPGEDTTFRAQITFSLHVLSRIGIADMSIALVRPDGTLIADSAVAIPGARPGSTTNVSMSVDVPADQTSATYNLQFDPKGLHPEFRQFPAPQVVLGSDYFPDLTIASITSPDQSPVDGETIYFDVTLANVGESPVDGVQVSGERILPDGTAEPLKSQVKIRQPLISLMPHTSATTRLRWDPFRNAGENVVRFTASSSYQTPDRNTDNNEVQFTLPVRSKARIQKGRIQVLPLTAEERQQRQIRIAAEIRNTGESAAQGLQVRYYASPEMKNQDLLGTTDIDRIAPGETHDAILTYQLKPGEENRQFRMNYEVLYRGARQRVPLDTED